MVHPINNGKRVRMSYSKIDEVLELPDLIEVQKKSYEWFVKEGLKEVFEDISPIQDYTGNLILEFVDYYISDEVKYDVEESKERDANYAAPLKVRVRLINRETGEVKEQEVFMGDFPLMTDRGTFIINGAERVIVSQLVRSPGVYYSMARDKTGKELYSSTVIPNRGAWLEYENDSNDILHVRIDRTRKLPLTVLVRALGIGTNAEIMDVFGEHTALLNTLEKDSAKNEEEGLIEVYKRLRPGEPPAVDSARSLLNSLFFDPKRYDLAKVGRYKFNKKLALSQRLRGQVAAANIIDPETGEILVEGGEKISFEMARVIETAGVKQVEVQLDDGRIARIIGNHFIEVKRTAHREILENAGFKEKIYYPVYKQIVDEFADDEDELKSEITKRARELSPKHIIIDDIVASISYQLNLIDFIGNTDDIDHLGNRRVRSVGELLQNQFRIGLSRMERVVKERMTIQDIDITTPQALINIRPVAAAIKEFFGSSQLSQFMDQTNPLAELTHKRRMSALGPGGLSRDRAGFEVRDVHASHYGRMCPIETPEGPNIGLINSLASYARINEYGFIETPYRRVDREDGRATSEIEYLTADVEDNFIVSQANEPLDENGYFINDRITVRAEKGTFDLVSKHSVDYMDVSPRQVVSVATAMIPFLENDDANRALMGANMQRQAVPLLRPEAPIVATGMEYKAGLDSGAVVQCKNNGTVHRVTADEVLVKRAEDGGIDRYKLLKFKRSNQGTCINQRPIVKRGEFIKKGEVIADGPATQLGEISLGKNLLIGFMTWEGYNFEDAVLLNENMVKNDVFTSIHIEEYESEARDTKLGPEEITRDIPNVGEEALKNLDARGIIRIGAEVGPGDIMVGKVTPKGETELTAEERLLRAIFGEKAREVRDTSLKVPHGQKGIIVDVKVFTRENGDELPPGVNELVRVYIATKRKMMVGDKMCGRHGNKGVVSRIMAEEDMPFMPDGTPLQVVLNPLGVPSRMNIGQVLEVHLGFASKTLGWHIATPVFDGAHFEDIEQAFEAGGIPKNGKIQLRDGRTGEDFANPVTVGYMYMLKLHHMVDAKIHARSTGPYSLVTQQPLGGKAQFGGQRFGEMEVWALQAYGAAHILQEILTVKSDDVVGRVKTYEAIVKGENIPESGIPESFKVLIKELQSLSLDITVIDNDEEIKLEREHIVAPENAEDIDNEEEVVEEEIIEEEILDEEISEDEIFEENFEDDFED
jgi:DNA-directed RNA polymerase subunit beta